MPKPIGPRALLVDPVKLHVKAGNPRLIDDELPPPPAVVLKLPLPVPVAIGIKFERRFSKLISTSGQ